MFKLTLNERNGCPGPTRTGIRHSFKGSRIDQLYYRAIKIISFYILHISNIQANTVYIPLRNSTVNRDNQTSSPLHQTQILNNMHNAVEEIQSILECV